MSSLSNALRRYRAGRFTDQDIVACAGLSVRSWRELIKTKAAGTITMRRGPGRVRVCDTDTFRRTAVIAALHHGGLSVGLAGRIVRSFIFERQAFGVIDPIETLFQSNAPVDETSGLPPRRADPAPDRIDARLQAGRRWFDPKRPSREEPEHDVYFEIVDGRWVAWRGFHDPVAANGGTPMRCRDMRNLFGEIRSQDNRPVFVSWTMSDFVSRLEPVQVNGRGAKARKDEVSPRRKFARYAASNPQTLMSVNASLAIRRAIRRYLGLREVPPAVIA